MKASWKPLESPITNIDKVAKNNSLAVEELMASMSLVDARSEFVPAKELVKGEPFKWPEGELTPVQHNVPRYQLRLMFFSGVIYVRAETERILQKPVWLRYIRILYVQSFDWLNHATRGRLGFR